MRSGVSQQTLERKKILETQEDTMHHHRPPHKRIPHLPHRSSSNRAAGASGQREMNAPVGLDPQALKIYTGYSPKSPNWDQTTQAESLQFWSPKTQGQGYGRVGPGEASSYGLQILSICCALHSLSSVLMHGGPLPRTTHLVRAILLMHTVSALRPCLQMQSFW